MLAPPVKMPKANSDPVSARIPKPPQHKSWRSGLGTPERMHTLQRAIGNQAKLNLLSQQAESLAISADHQKQEAGPAQTADREAQCPALYPSKLSAFKPDLARRPQTPSPILQRKLAIGHVDDPLEHEADRVANEVLAAALPIASGAPSRIQRLSSQLHGQMGSAPPSISQALASPGRPLEPALQQDMEQRFGYDFSQVRVHVDAAAEQSAREVNARAYTAGDNIVFGGGRFAPATQAGRRLIAHELTHVAQQRTLSASQASSDIVQRESSVRRDSEREAVVQLKWQRDLDRADFVDRLVAIVSRLPGFRGVPKDHIRAALMIPGITFFTGHQLLFKTGQEVQLRISASFERSDLQHMWVTNVEPRQPLVKKGPTPSTTTESPRSKAGDPARQAQKPVPGEEAFGAVTWTGGRVSVVWPDPPPSSVPDDKTIVHLIRSDVLYRHPKGEPADYSQFLKFVRSPGEGWFLDWAYHWPWRERQSSAVALSQSEEFERQIGMFERETGVKYPQKINQGLYVIGAKLLKEANPLSLKNLPYTIAGVVIPIGAMKLITMDVDELTNLVRIEWQIDEDIVEASETLRTSGPAEQPPAASTPMRDLKPGDIIDTSQGQQRVVEVGPRKIVTEPSNEPPTGGTQTSAAAAAKDFRYATKESWIYHEREIRIVETPSGTRAFYKRTGSGRPGPLGPQKDDWAPMKGFEPGAGRLVKAPELYPDAEFDPSKPLTQYGFENEEGEMVNYWIKTEPVEFSPVDVGDAWSVIQENLKKFGVKVKYPDF